MRAATEFRLAFFVDDEREVLIIRPIGWATGAEFVQKIFEAYESIEAPWRYKRLHDHRRFLGIFNDVDLDEYLIRWALLAEEQDYNTDVAVVELSATAGMRHAKVSPVSDNETICYFTDYHEAMGWLHAKDKDGYLKRVRALPLRHLDTGSIDIH